MKKMTSVALILALIVTVGVSLTNISKDVRIAGTEDIPIYVGNSIRG